MPETPPLNTRLSVRESRDFRSFHAFLRASRTHMEKKLYRSMYDSYRNLSENGNGQSEVLPKTVEQAMPVFDDMPEFLVYQWMYRHLQQFKYSRSDRGIVAAVEMGRDDLTAGLEDAARNAGNLLKLNPDIQLPDYYRMVDFHQQPGGVWSDVLDGFIYEMGRRTTVPQHGDPNAIYRMMFEQLPEGREFKKVLDWGTGVGAGIIEWKKAHPNSDCYGADIAAPCLKLAHRRALEAGTRIAFSQQDLEFLDFEDNSFDLLFHMFMFHEIPVSRLGDLLSEAARVLEVGGVMAGPEFHLTPKSPFQNIIQLSHSWTNNETYAAGWYDVCIEDVAIEAGFSKVSVEPFWPIMDTLSKDSGDEKLLPNYWYFYVFEK